MSDELLAQLDDRAARLHRSRSDLIREALDRYFAEDREADIDCQIVEAYERRPQELLAAAEWSARASIAAEPWE